GGTCCGHRPRSCRRHPGRVPGPGRPHAHVMRVAPGSPPPNRSHMNAFTIEFDIDGTGPVAAGIERAIIAGYTGRDRASVQAHIDELAAIGIPPPPQVPMFYPIPRELLTNDAAVE